MLKVLRSYSGYERRGRTPHPRSHREKAHLEPTSAPCRAASLPSHSDVPGAVPGHGTILQGHFFLDLIFWEGKLVPAFCQWSFAVKDMGPFPQGEGRRRLGPGFSSRQTSRTLPWGGSCMMPARLSEPYANHGIREVMASALHHPGVSFYFWPLSSPLTPNRP